MIIKHQEFKYQNTCVLERIAFTPPFKPTANYENEVCFFYPVKAKGIFFGGANKISFQSRESLLLRCGQFVNHYKKLPQEKNEIYDIIGIHITPELLSRIYDNKLPNFLSSKKNKEIKSLHKLEPNAIIDEYIKNLMFYFDNEFLVNSDLIALKVKELLLLLYNINEQEVRELLENLFDPAKESFKTIIESHIFEDLSLEEFSKLTNTSLSTFKRKFKEIFKESPSKYITNQRLIKAKQLLKLSNLRIIDICFECGFNNPSTFSKAFIKKYNIAPSKMRKSN